MGICWELPNFIVAEEVKIMLSTLRVKTIFALGAFLVVLQFCCGTLWALPVKSHQAEKVVKGWLLVDAKPLGTDIGHQVISVETFTDIYEQPIYYVVYLRPSGFVIVSADDLIEPIVGFCSKGIYDSSPDNPFGALVSQDMKNRMAHVKDLQAKRSRQPLPQSETTSNKAGVKARNKWTRLQNYADDGIPESIIAPLQGDGIPAYEFQEAQAFNQSSELGNLNTLSDIRVAPLVQSKWSQSRICYSNLVNCYNYYTPNNYVCGCVATALAQLLRYHQYPTMSIGVNTFEIFVNGKRRYADTRGGDGQGGPYNWDDMVLVPDCTTTRVQRQAIGALCYDAGVSVNMSYSAGGSGSWTWKSANALVSTFGYMSSNLGFNDWYNIGDGLNNMVNPNLDGGYPVLFSVFGNGYIGHAIICDGYGYNVSALYHHLNMGWEGYDDAWYNLPIIQGDYADFSSIEECAYNIFVSGSGEIISGRVIDVSSNPIKGAIVTAQDGGGKYTAETNDKGIYALAKIPSASSYTLNVVKTGYRFMDREVETGTSIYAKSISGNRWGINISALPSDEFGNSHFAGWTIVDDGDYDGPSDWHWSASEDVMTQSSNIYSKPTSNELPKLGTYAWYAKGTLCTDYQLSMTMRSDDDDGIGVMFRYKDENNYYRFSWDKQRAFRRLVKCENGEFSLLVPEESIAYETGRTYYVEIVVNGPDIEVWIDSNKIFSVSDTTFPEGTIGLYSWGNAGSYFGDILFENLSGVNLVPVISSVTAKLPMIFDDDSSQLDVVTSDPDYGPFSLSYSWSVPTGHGSLSSTNVANPIYTPPDVNATQTFTLAVEISDGENPPVTVTGTVDVRVWDANKPHLLNENFDDGDYTGWTVVDQGDYDGPSGWSAAAGTMVQRSNIYSLPAGHELPKLGTYTMYELGIGWIDYRITLTISSDDDDAIGLMFRYQDSDNYYRFSWDRQRTYRRLIKKINGFVSLLDLAEDNVPYVTGQDYQLEVLAQGSTLEVSIDGVIIFSVADNNSLSSGTIALYSWANQGSYFDDIVVENLSQVNLGPVILSVTATPSKISDVNQTSQLLVDARDPDFSSSQLSYSWTVQPGNGSLDDPCISNPVYTPPDVSSTQAFTLTVEVSDGEDTVSSDVNVTVTDGNSPYLLEEDFDDGDCYGWEIVDEGDRDTPSDWSCATGTMIQNSNIYSLPTGPELPKLGTYIWYTDGLGWSDYQFSLMMRSNDDDGIGVMFRYQDENNYYRFDWNKQRKYCRLVKCDSGSFELLEKGPDVYVTEQWYDLDIVVQGAILKVYIDDKLIFSHEEGSLSSGSIALYCWGNVGSYFDNIVVEVLPSVNQAPMISSVTATPSTISEDQTCQLQVDANDPDNGPGPLSYNWIVQSGEGTLDSNTIANPVYIPPDVSCMQTFTLTVEVSDGEDTATRTVDVTVTDPNCLYLDCNGWEIVDEGDLDAPSEWECNDDTWCQSSNIYSLPAGNELPKKGSYVWYIPGIYWTDYHVGLTIISDDDDSVGVMFRYQDKNNYYRFSWDKQRAFRRLVKCENGVVTLLAEETVAYITGQSYDVEIVAHGKTLQILIDASAIFSVTDVSLSSGTIALYNWGNSGSCFSDIVVKDLSGVNQAPVILSMMATPSTIYDDETCDLELVADDPDLSPSPLSYSWAVQPGEGGLDDPCISNPVYTPPDVNSTQTFTLTVAVSDGEDTTTSTIDVMVKDANKTYLLEEDFDDGDYVGWKIVEEGNRNVPSDWSAATGTMIQSSNIYSSPVALSKLGTYAWYTDGLVWTDYNLSLIMRSNDDDGIGVMFRYQDENNYYRFDWDKQREYCRLVKCDSGSFKLLEKGPDVYVTEQWYDLDIVVQGAILKVYIDDKLIFSHEEGSLSSGSIALYSWGNEGSCFDDILVEGLHP